MSFEFHTTLISLEEMNNFINIIKKKFANLKTLEECSIGEISHKYKVSDEDLEGLHMTQMVAYPHTSTSKTMTHTKLFLEDS